MIFKFIQISILSLYPAVSGLPIKILHLLTVISACLHTKLSTQLKAVDDFFMCVVSSMTFTLNCAYNVNIKGIAFD